MKELLEQFETDLTLEESQNKNILKNLRFNYVRAEKLNGNNRIYPEDIISKDAKRFNDELKKSGISGQLNHPKIVGTELDKISHVITSISYDPKTKLGIAEAAILNTTKGKDLLTLINSNIKLGASMRGYGTMGANNRVNGDFKLRSIDLVENPSFGADTMISKSNLIESGNVAFEEIEDDEIDEEKEKLVISDLGLTPKELEEAIKEISEMTEREFDMLGGEDGIAISKKETLEELKKLREGSKFFSLRDSLSVEIRERFGKDVWIVDYSNDEVVFKKENETKYQKISYKIKDEKVELSGDPKEVEKKIQYERLEQLQREHNLLKEKLKNLENKKGKQENLNEQIEEARKELQSLVRPRSKLNEGKLMEKNKEIELRRAFAEARAWDFIPKDQTFEEFAEKMEESAKELGFDFETTERKKLAEKKEIDEEIQRGIESGLSGTILENIQYEQALYGGFKGNFAEWKEAMKRGKKNLEEAQELAKLEPLTPQEMIEISFQKSREVVESLNRENLRRGQLKQYHSDVEKGVFEGSFVEWLMLAENEVEGAKKQILLREHSEAVASGYSGTFEDFLALQREHEKNR